MGMSVAVMITLIAAIGCSDIDDYEDVPAAVVHGGSGAEEVIHSAFRLQRSDAPAAPAQPTPELSILGRGRQGRIVDAAGKVVWQGSEATPLYGLQPSPDGRRVVLYFGDADYSVRSVAGLDAGTSLPRRPVHVNATGFGEWRWLDENRLLGVAEIPAAQPESGATAAEIESRSPAATLLSVYDLRDSMLKPVEVAEGLPEVFEIGAIRDGRIELRVVGAAESVWTELRRGPTK